MKRILFGIILGILFLPLAISLGWFLDSSILILFEEITWTESKEIYLNLIKLL